MINKNKLNFDNYHLNVNFSKSIAYTDFKFLTFYLGFSFCFIPKIGKHFVNFSNIIF